MLFKGKASFNVIGAVDLERFSMKKKKKSIIIRTESNPLSVPALNNTATES